MLDKIKFKMRERLPKSQKTNRIIKVCICFLVALLMTASIFIAQRQQNTVVTVIKPSKVISVGTKIKDADLKAVEVGEYGLPKEAINTTDKIVGQFAKSDIYPSDFITNEKLTKEKAAPFTTLKENQKIMSFTVPTLAASVASNIKIGDKIQVMYSETITDQTGINNEFVISAPECLKSLKVIDIKDTNGYTQVEEKKGNTNMYAATSFIPSVITVIANDEQATELYKAEMTKSIYAIFVER